MELINIKQLGQIFKSHSGLLRFLSKRRKSQIFFLFVISILSAISETANIGILIPFLGILSDVQNNINKLGIFAVLFKGFPSDILLPVLVSALLH